MTIAIQGLSQQEVLHRRQNGQGNDLDLTPSRTYTQILVKNIFNFVNIVLILIGALLVVLGSPSDAITTSTLVILNMVAGIFQEMRAKRQLDKIALLSRPTVIAIRAGQEVEIDPAELVIGDVVILQAGDQIVCDGRVLNDTRIEVNESLLTGESDHVVKTQNDEVLSGSYCVTGQAHIEIIRVGAESFANKLTRRAREFTSTTTPLQQDVNLIIRIVAFITFFMYALLYLNALRIDLSTVERVQIAAVVVGMIPQGLIFLVTLNYALGAVRVSGKGALIQQNNAVESMSNVDVLCLDKTGTLTTNNIQLHHVFPFTLDEDALTAQLATFAASVTSSNRTNDAIKKAHPTESISFTDEVPFSSVYKWSGLVWADQSLKGAYILGAPEIITPYLNSNDQEFSPSPHELAEEGLRVVMFAYHPDINTLHDDHDKPYLPNNLTLLGIITFVDELRSDAFSTFQAFDSAGIALKIISGDNPSTVSALAKQAQFDISGGVVSGIDLAGMTDTEFDHAVEHTSVFGRITPDQKERIVKVLQGQGHYVAMVGDGVNDVLSLKTANIGIAMESGSTATRNVADIVLLNDTFSVLPEAFKEGQRIINGIEATMLLLLSRTTYVVLLVLMTSLTGVSFPFVPSQDALNSFTTAGLPPFLLALWATAQTPTNPLLPKVRNLVLPVGFSVAIFGFALYLYGIDQETLPIARTILINFVMMCGLVWIVFVKPPIKQLAIIDTVTSDKRPLLLSIVLIVLLAIMQAITPIRDFFELESLTITHLGIITGSVLLWGITLRTILRYQLFKRFIASK